MPDFVDSADPRIQAIIQFGQDARKFQHSVGEYADLWIRNNLLELRSQLAARKADGPDSNWLKDLEKLAKRRTKKIQKFLQRNSNLNSSIASLFSESSISLSANTQDGLTLDEFLLLRSTLCRLSILSEDDTFTIDQFQTGVGNLSRGFFVFVPDGRTGKRYFAKFDKPDRAAQEWRAIKLLRALNVPAEAILPLPHNDQIDGVIIYPVAGAHGLRDVQDLKVYVKSQLEGAPDHCIRAIDMAVEPLRYFHDIEPGQMSDRLHTRLTTWRTFFGDRFENKQLRDRISDMRNIDWTTALLAVTNGKPWPNPLGDLEKRLSKKTGHIHRSFVHGDLNFTNVTVGFRSDRSPARSYVIDLAELKNEFPSVDDFARLEVDVTLVVFGELVKEREIPETHWHTDYVRMRERLDGRSSNEAFQPGLGAGLAKVVHAVRSHALRIISRMPKALPEEYFVCLYFEFLTQLQYEDVWTEPNKKTLALLGAAAALQTISDIEGGNYSVNATSRFVFAPSMEVEAPKNVATQDQLQQSRVTPMERQR